MITSLCYMLEVPYWVREHYVRSSLDTVGRALLVCDPLKGKFDFTQTTVGKDHQYSKYVEVNRAK
jgi:hypothetical protein